MCTQGQRIQIWREKDACSRDSLRPRSISADLMPDYLTFLVIRSVVMCCCWRCRGSKAAEAGAEQSSGPGGGPCINIKPLQVYSISGRRCVRASWTH